METTTVQVAAFLAEHNLPVRLSSFFLELLKVRAPKNGQEAKSLQKILMAAIKFTNVICQGVGLYCAKEGKLIPLSNIIGYSSDTCNVMFGENLSVSTLLKKDLPHVAAIKCSCPMIHICASHACIKLSTTLEDLCRNIYSHLCRSTINQKDFTQFYIRVREGATSQDVETFSNKMAVPGKLRHQNSAAMGSPSTVFHRICGGWERSLVHNIEYFERLEQHILCLLSWSS